MSLPGLLPQELPAPLTETRQIPGFRNRQWVSQQLAPWEERQIRDLLPALDARMEPAADVRVIMHVARLLSHWSVKKGDDQASVLDDFATDLTGYSEAHIIEACAEWRRSSRHRPVPADLLAVLDRLRAVETERRHRARVLLGLEEPRPWERAIPSGDDDKILTPEEKTQRRREILKARGIEVE